MIVYKMQFSILYFEIFYDVRYSFIHINVVLSIITFQRTKQFMKKHFRSYFGVVDDKDEDTDLPASEYFRFVKFWDITVIFSDVLTLYGTVWIVFNTVVYTYLSL